MEKLGPFPKIGFLEFFGVLFNCIHKLQICGGRFISTEHSDTDTRHDTGGCGTYLLFFFASTYGRVASWPVVNLEILYDLKLVRKSIQNSWVSWSDTQLIPSMTSENSLPLVTWSGSNAMESVISRITTVYMMGRVSRRNSIVSALESHHIFF